MNNNNGNTSSDGEKIITEKKNRIRQRMLSLAAVTATTFYPCTFIYFNNCFEVNFADIIIPFLILLAIGFIIYLIFSFVFKDEKLSGGFAAVTQFLLMNYGMMTEKLDITSVWFTLIPYLILMSFVIAIYSIKKYKGGVLEISKAVCGVVKILFTVGFSFLVVFNAIAAIPDISVKMENLAAVEANKKANPDDNIGKTIVNTSGKSNIYYILIDEYSSQNAFDRYCDFDNSEFIGELEDMKFNVSDTSYSGTTATWALLTRLFDLGGDFDFSKKTAGALIMSRNSLFEKVNSNGYEVSLIDYTGFIPPTSEDNIYRGNEMNTSYTDRAEYYIFSRTALNFAYWKLFCTPSSMSRTKSFDTQIDLVKQQTLIHEKPVFTFFYTDIVHGPWAFDENGNSLPDDEMGYKWENPEYYIGHVKYCNAKLAPMLREIIVNDPECVIIIQSDHSFRGIYHTDILNGNTSIDADAENKYMSNIFNAVYYKGEEYDIEGLSMVNTPIKILNDEFDEDIPYTEDVFIARPLDD